MPLSAKVKMTVLKDNLEAQEKDFCKLSQIRFSNLSDVARVANDFLLTSIQNGESLNNALLNLGERCREKGSVFTAKDRFGALMISDQYVFSNLLAKKLFSHYPDLLEKLLPTTNDLGRVALVKNKSTEEYLATMQDVFPFTSTVYSVDFKDAALRVLDGEADFCLLPYAENSYFPIYSVLDAAMRAELLLVALLKTDELTYGVYGKTRPLAGIKTFILQYAYPPQMTFPVEILDKVDERFSYKNGTEHVKIDTWKEENHDTIISAMLYFKLFAPEVKIIGCATTL